MQQAQLLPCPSQIRCLPSVCHATPKYLEVQYHCEKISVEKGQQTRFPKLQRNIKDVWSNRNKALKLEDVKAAINIVIENSNIPKTEEPKSRSVFNILEDKKDNSNVEIFKNQSYVIKSLEPSDSVDNLQSSQMSYEEVLKTSPMFHTKQLLQEKSYPNNTVHWTSKEVLILILSSSLSVILIIITAAMVIIKVQVQLLS